MRKALSAVPPLALLLVSACALSPQAVRLDPAVEVTPGNVGGGQTVALEVRDARPDPVLGTRSGVYSQTSVVTLAGDVSEPVRRAVTRLLAARGFQVTAPGAAERRLVVSVEQIGYAAEGAPVVRSVKLSATVHAAATRPGAEQSARYRAEHTREVLTAPDEGDNARMINAVLGKALTRLGADDELLRTLAR